MPGPDAELIYAGKEGGGPSVGQAEITGWLVEHGRAGRDVVRLKGGDPFVFGRGGEEAEALHEAGIAFEVVSGDHRRGGGVGLRGIPVTHRDAASAVAFLTGHEDPDKPDTALDWPALAAFPGTLVVYMGVRQLPPITERLRAGGRAADEPAAVIERGTLGGQRVVTGTLATIADVAAAGRHPRAGDLAVRGGGRAARSARVARARPLAGRTIAVTRARAQASAPGGTAARARR